MNAAYIAWNEVTGLFWDGRAFAGSLGEAKYLDSTELAALKYAYLNVGHSIQA